MTMNTSTKGSDEKFVNVDYDVQNSEKSYESFEAYIRPFSEIVDSLKQRK